VEQSGIVFFFAYRLDYVLLLHYGGLGMLGRYVALMTVAGLVPMVNGFFMDTLLPSLTNTLAARNSAGAAQVFIMHMRILFLVATAMSCGVMVLAPTATSLMGDKYRSIQSLIILMGMIQGIAHPAAFGGTVLLSIGRQRLTTWSALLHMVLFAGLFFVLWPIYGLTGAVIAYAVALTVSFASMMLIAGHVAPAFPSINGLWLKAALVDVLICFISLYWGPLGLVAGMAVWVGAMAVFMVTARYKLDECRMLTALLMPGAGSALTRHTVAAGSSAQSA
jgi:O-antigen/teichoic acid export membrane protein